MRAESRKVILIDLLDLQLVTRCSLSFFNGNLKQDFVWKSGRFHTLLQLTNQYSLTQSVYPE